VHPDLDELVLLICAELWATLPSSISTKRPAPKSKELGNQAKFFPIDVTDTESIELAVKDTVEWMKKTGSTQVK